MKCNQLETEFKKVAANSLQVDALLKVNLSAGALQAVISLKEQILAEQVEALTNMKDVDRINYLSSLETELPNIERSAFDEAAMEVWFEALMLLSYAGFFAITVLSFVWFYLSKNLFRNMNNDEKEVKDVKQPKQACVWCGKDCTKELTDTVDDAVKVLDVAKIAAAYVEECEWCGYKVCHCALFVAWGTSN